MTLTDDMIRQRAYAIWEAEGRPEGREAQHWQQACRELRPDQPGQDPAFGLSDPSGELAGELSGQAPSTRSPATRRSANRETPKEALREASRTERHPEVPAHATQSDNTAVPGGNRPDAAVAEDPARPGMVDKSKT